MLRQGATSGLSRNLGPNQRCIMPSAIPAKPSFVIISTRSCHSCGVPMRAAVFDSTSARNRSGLRAASDWPISPPTDRPTKITGPRPKVVMSDSASWAKSAMLGAPPRSESPCPRLSKRINRRPSGKSGKTACHMRKSVPSELAKTTAAPSLGPWSS